MDSLPPNLPNRGKRRIAIASGKGGVGKTWFAITLAHALAQAGASVLLADGDFGLANIDVQLGLNPAHDLAGVLSGRVPMAQATACVAAGGFHILPGRSGSGSLAALPPATLEWLLEGLAAQDYATLLVDLGAGLDAANRRLAAWADTLLVVATDEPTSLTDAYAVLKLYASDCAAAGRQADARVVVNQAATTASGARTYATLARACTQFLGAAPSLAGIVRRDDRVRDAIRRQTPLLTRHPNCPAAQDVRRIAEDAALSAYAVPPR